MFLWEKKYVKLEYYVISNQERKIVKNITGNHSDIYKRRASIPNKSIVIWKYVRKRLGFFISFLALDIENCRNVKSLSTFSKQWHLFYKIFEMVKLCKGR